MQQANGPPIKREMDQFLTLPDEELLFAKRKHWITVAIPLVVQVWIGLMLIGLSYFIFSFLLSQFLFFLISMITLTLLFMSFMAKSLVDWYFHFYVITTRKIVEYCCVPLFTHTINEVLLDQVRCTEIDVRTEGFINQLINKGDVTVTFDRPTHQEEMVLSDINNPRDVGIYLADTFDMLKTDNSKEGVWFRSKSHPRRFYFTDGFTKGGYA